MSWSKLPDWVTTADKTDNEQVARAGQLTLLIGVTKLTFGMMIPIVLVRFLTPEDFGIAAMALPFLAIAQTISTHGGIEYILRIKQVSAARLSDLFIFCLFISGSAYLVLAALSVPIADYYDQSILTQLILTGGLGLLLMPVITLHGSLARRFFRQDIVVKSEFFSSSIGAIVGIYLGWVGFGPWALILIPLMRQMIMGGTLLLLVRWIPGRKTGDFSEFIRFGLHITSSNLALTLIRQMDKILIGWFHGAAALGYYALAYTITMAPVTNITTPIAGWAIPLLTERSNTIDELCKNTGTILVLLAILFSPLLWAALESVPVTLFLFGPDWLATAEILRALLLFSFLTVLQFPLIWILLAADATSRYSLWNIIYTAAILIAVIVQLPGGGLDVAYGLACTAAVSLILLPAYCGYFLGFNPLLLYLPLILLMLVSTISVFCYVSISSTMPEMNWLSLVIKGFLFEFLFCATALLTFRKRIFAMLNHR